MKQSTPKPLSDMSLDELKSQEKTQSGLLGALIGLVVIMSFVAGFMTYQKGFNVFTVLPVAFFPLVPVGLVSLKKTKAEISSRSV